MDREAAARAIADEARRLRKRPSRALWVAALVVSVLCLGGLAYGLVTGWNRDRPAAAARQAGSTNGSGFGLGLTIGGAAGIAIGSLAALRRRQR